MANTISTRSAIFVQFNVDLNAAGGVALSLVCNRDYAVVDYNVLVVAAGAGSATNASITATDTLRSRRMPFVVVVLLAKRTSASKRSSTITTAWS